MRHAPVTRDVSRGDNSAVMDMYQVRDWLLCACGPRGRSVGYKLSRLQASPFQSITDAVLDGKQTAWMR